MERPASSSAVVEPGDDGCTIVLPAQGARRHWRGWVAGLLLVGSLAGFAGCAAVLLVRAQEWTDRLVWLAILLACLLVVRPAYATFNHRIVVPSLERGRLIVTSRDLSLRRVVIRARRRVWSVGSIGALDEEAGALVVLSDRQLDHFFGGRDEQELRWLAALLRQTLGVPADPPGLISEIAVEYRMPGWPAMRRGFVLIEPGQLRLRPRFSLTEGLVLRAAGESDPGRPGDGLAAGSLPIHAEDIRWGIGAGGLVLRVGLYEPGVDESVTLEIATARGEELTAGVARLFRSAER